MYSKMQFGVDKKVECTRILFVFLFELWRRRRHYLVHRHSFPHLSFNPIWVRIRTAIHRTCVVCVFINTVYHPEYNPLFSNAPSSKNGLRNVPQAWEKGVHLRRLIHGIRICGRFNEPNKCAFGRSSRTQIWREWNIITFCLLLIVFEWSVY